MDCNSIPSSSSSSKIWKYHVFVSFRGEDVRKTFADYLFAAFRRKGIHAFRDDRDLKKGEPILADLIQVIEGSQVLVVVFSKNYANSTWCLRELEKIVDCAKESGQTVLPIFYDVSPSEVRKQSGAYKQAFAEHEERFKEDLDMVQGWKGAMVHVGNLSGQDVQDKPQSSEIDKIVEEVRKILGYGSSSVADDLVGIDPPVEQLEKLLVSGSNDDVRVLGICGMGGIGKTTLARVLYDKIYRQYGGYCFIDDVSKIYKDYGPIGVPKQLLCQIQNEKSEEIWNLSKATSLIRTLLAHVKALIVLDNVDKIDQLENLPFKWLYAGSRIIIISRDKHILREYGVDEVYNVQLLNRDKALQLFCRKAFKCDYIPKNYKELAYRAIGYCQDLPLAIKVLGSFLCGRDICEWKSALARLSDNPMEGIMGVLRVSFDGLEPTEKEIFLDIACFFRGHDKTYVMGVLNNCEFYPDIGIKVLVERSLLTIEKSWFEMHDMLQELGKKIVREKAPKEPRMWSRLWDASDIQNVLLQKKVIGNLEAIEAIRLRSWIRVEQKKKTLRAEGLSKMSSLRLLIIVGNAHNFSGSLNYVSNELRHLEWDDYPFTSLPSSFEPDKLVELKMQNSNIKQLWEGIKTLYNLRIMDISESKNLTETPNFKGVPNLERLILQGCTKLVGIKPSIGRLRKLVELNLEGCSSLLSLPKSMLRLSSLEVLNLKGCSKIKLFNNQLLKRGRHAEHLKKVDISEAPIQCQSTSSIFSCLRDLNLSFCNLLEIPNAIGWLHCLESLDLGGNNFVTLHSSIKKLCRLVYLSLQNCEVLRSLFEGPSSLVLPVRRELGSGEYEVGLNISDCPKLLEMQRHRRMAISWMLQVVKVYQESSRPCPGIHVIIPGTQIPTWFNFKNIFADLDADLFADLSPMMHDNNCIGVAFCLAFSNGQTYDSDSQEDSCQTYDSASQEYITIWLNVHLNGQYRTKAHSSIPFTFRKYPMKDLRERSSFEFYTRYRVTDQMEHLCLLYFCPEDPIIRQLSEGINDNDSFKMEVHLEVSCSVVFAVEVNSWGYRLVYKPDLELETNNDLLIEQFESERMALPLNSPSI